MKEKFAPYIWTAAIMLFPLSAVSEPYYWILDMNGNVMPEHYASPRDACKSLLKRIPPSPTVLDWEARFGANEKTYTCWSLRLGTNGSTTWMDSRYGSRLKGLECPVNMAFNPTTGECGNDLQKGEPPICSTVANPIDVSIGNKVQREVDYQSAGNSKLYFSRFYNSTDGVWRHSLSTHLRFGGNQYASIVTSTGKELHYRIDGATPVPVGSALGVLARSGATWTYTDTENQVFEFNTSGKLIRHRDPVGRTIVLTYTGAQVNVIDDSGNELTFTQDSSYQPLTVSTPTLQIHYAYNSERRLTSLARLAGNEEDSRQFHYDDPRNNRLLTGITDAKGIKFAQWSYDDLGRAISSEHVNGQQKNTVSYNGDGSSIVVNEYEKIAIYRFKFVNGINYVSSIEGEPTPNCPYSNSTFTYDTRGQLKTQADAKGNLTTYEYNDRGLEVSRTEAAGTPQARTITTEWHPTLFLKTQVTEPGRVIRYQYDAQGRPTGQTTTAL